VWKAFWSAQQRFFKLLCVSLKVAGCLPPATAPGGPLGSLPLGPCAGAGAGAGLARRPSCAQAAPPWLPGRHPQQPLPGARRLTARRASPASLPCRCPPWWPRPRRRWSRASAWSSGCSPRARRQRTPSASSRALSPAS
jgi:hypothetical protein